MTISVDMVKSSSGQKQKKTEKPIKLKKMQQVNT